MGTLLLMHYIPQHEPDTNAKLKKSFAPVSPTPAQLELGHAFTLEWGQFMLRQELVPFVGGSVLCSRQALIIINKVSLALLARNSSRSDKRRDICRTLQTAQLKCYRPMLSRLPKCVAGEERERERVLPSDKGLEQFCSFPRACMHVLKACEGCLFKEQGLQTF